MIIEFQGRKPEVAPDAYIAPNATVLGHVKIGPGSSVWFGTVIRGDTEEITVGENTNLQDLTVVHADLGKPTSLGNMVTVGHRAIIHGCTIEDECMIGMGAIVMNGAKVERYSIVAAGAVVLEGFRVPTGTLVAGVPAKVLRELKPEEIERIREIAGIYMRETKLYRSGRKLLGNGE
jgi:carbonic anhydrase/acetyltransferase-like protein (isoleucine patch superfamily)